MIGKLSQSWLAELKSFSKSQRERRMINMFTIDNWYSICQLLQMIHRAAEIARNQQSVYECRQVMTQIILESDLAMNRQI